MVLLLVLLGLLNGLGLLMTPVGLSLDMAERLPISPRRAPGGKGFTETKALVVEAPPNKMASMHNPVVKRLPCPPKEDFHTPPLFLLLQLLLLALPLSLVPSTTTTAASWCCINPVVVLLLLVVLVKKLAGIVLGDLLLRLELVWSLISLLSCCCMSLLYNSPLQWDSGPWQPKSLSISV